VARERAISVRRGAGEGNAVPGLRDAPIVELRDIWMEFPGVVALAGVSLDIPRGKVLALAGENGAGKSTLVSILAGVHAGYRGEVQIDGQRTELGDPNRARAAGIALVEQELSLVPELSVAENILLGEFPGSDVPGLVSRSRLEASARKTLEIMEIDLPLRRPVRELSPANAQVVEIAKGLARRPRLLILDEPTSSLTKSETEKLIGLIGKLREGGTTILYISHKLHEVLEIADNIAVLRDGHKVAEGPSVQWTEERLIQAMVGRDLNQFYQRTPSRPGDVVLSVKHLGLAGVFSDVTFSLRAGEIVGMAGLIGAGRTDVASSLFGLRPATAGSIAVRGEEIRIASPQAALAHGIALVPEDRRRDGFVPDLSTWQNISLATLRAVCRGPFIDRQKERTAVDAIARKVNLDASMLRQPTRTLSGGNKQKSVIAKVLLLSPAVLILDEPTRGIDVGAKAEIYGLIHELTLAGMATLLISSEMPELLGVCDRILVMRRGRLVAEFDRSSATEEALMTAASVGSLAMRDQMEARI
jgi:ABC-type sugar transport system ATPase subunit